MDLNLEQPGNYNFIRSFSEQGILIGERYYKESLIVSAGELIAEWPPCSTDQISIQHLSTIFEMKPEVVLLGTGEKQHFLPPELMVLFYENQSGLEVMTTAAACRTFNVLVSEGRNVVAALIQEQI